MSPETPHTPEPDGSLRELLDEAGRAAQPRHPGWDTLPRRLAGLPQLRRRRWLLPAVGAAAAAVAAAVFLLSGKGPGPVQDLRAEELPIQVVRQDVELTILSISEQAEETLYMPLIQRLAPLLPPGVDPVARGIQGLAWNELAGRAPMPVPVPPPPPPARVAGINVGGPAGTGQAFVKDHRLILNLKKGDNVVRFTDVPATIDPTSVRFLSNTDPTGTQVLEQNFEYDLATADTLLRRFLDKAITCVGRDGSETTGFLAAVDDLTIVLADKPTPPPGEKVRRGTQTLTRGALRAVRLPEVPKELLVKPTLVWKLHAATPGKHDTTVSYLCGRMHWFADYIALVQPGAGTEPDTIDLSGWVSLVNDSGATYPDAGLKLIAGDVNRKRDPWAPEKLIPVEMPAMPAGPGGGGGGGTMLVKKEFVEKGFFEYHLYTLSAPSTVRDREVKQLNLLQKRGIKAERCYVYSPMSDTRRVAVELTAKNEVANHLGVPLPKGRVRLEQPDADGDTALLGQVETDHTAVKEELRLPYGYAADVSGQMKTLASVKRGDSDFTATYEFRVRNHKNEPIRTRVVVSTGAYAEGTVAKASRAYTMHDYKTAHFDFTLGPDAEEVLTVTIDYHYAPAVP